MSTAMDPGVIVPAAPPPAASVAPPPSAATADVPPASTSDTVAPGNDPPLEGAGKGAESRIRQLIQQGKAERATAEAQMQALTAANAALAQRLEALSGVQDRLREVFVPPAAPETEWQDPAIVALQRDVEMYKARTQALDEERQGRVYAQEIRAARTKFPIPSSALPIVIGLMRADPALTATAAVEQVHGYGQGLLAAAQRQSAAAAEPPPLPSGRSLASVLPANYTKPKSLEEAGETLRRLIAAQR